MSEDQDLDPRTSPDVQEALSWVQGNRTIMLLPLSSGRVAIFGRDFQLYKILDEVPTKPELQVLSNELNTKLIQRHHRQPTVSLLMYKYNGSTPFSDTKSHTGTPVDLGNLTE